jgi:hypothetical protein
LIEIYSEGDTVCRNCGTVVSSHNFYEDVKYNNHSFEDHEPLSQEVYGISTNISHNLGNKLSKYVLCLDLPDVVEVEAKSILEKIYEKKTFKGNRVDAVIACVIYMAMNKHKDYNVRRTAKEISDGLGIEFKVFTKALRDIMSEASQNEEKNGININTNKMDDTLTRQIRETLQDYDTTITNKDVMKIARLVKILDEERKNKKLMLGSPPYVTNSILIYMICDKEKNIVTLPDKNVYAKRARLSRGTLDKHLNLLVKANICSSDK